MLVEGRMLVEVANDYLDFCNMYVMNCIESACQHSEAQEND